MIKLGSVVRLKSGGPAMTVEGIHKDAIQCVWFNVKTLNRDTFNKDLLVSQPKRPGKITELEIQRILKG